MRPRVAITLSIKTVAVFIATTYQLRDYFL